MSNIISICQHWVTSDTVCTDSPVGNNWRRQLQITCGCRRRIFRKSEENRVCGDVSTYHAYFLLLTCTHSTSGQITHEVGGTTTSHMNSWKRQPRATIHVTIFCVLKTTSDRIAHEVGGTSTPHMNSLKRKPRATIHVSVLDFWKPEFHPRFWNVLQKFLGHFSQAKIERSRESCLEFRSDTGRCVRAT